MIFRQLHGRLWENRRIAKWPSPKKRLMVIDATCTGKAGHAARNEGINAINIAAADIQKINAHAFARISDVLGPVKTTVTVIHAGKQHQCGSRYMYLYD